MLKDFVAVAGPLGVTHFMIFTKTPSSVNMVNKSANTRGVFIIETVVLFKNHLLFKNQTEAN